MGEPYKSGVELLSFHTVSKVGGSGKWVSRKYHTGTARSRTRLR